MRPNRPVILLLSALVMSMAGCSLTTAPSEEAPPSVAAGSNTSDLLLHNDGLGPFRFGDSAEAVIDALTSTIGGWDADSRESDVGTIPTCEAGQGRQVLWGSLVLTFVERAGSEAFSSWAYGFDPLTGNTDDTRGLGLATPEGIGLGTTRSELIDIYGSTVSFVDDAVLDTTSFLVSGNEPTQLGGNLDATNLGGTIDFLETTPTC